MISSRSALYFKRLSSVTSEIIALQRVVKDEVMLNELRIQHAEELKRVYAIIDDSARKGHIRTYLPFTDPFWKNSFVQSELQRNGFIVDKCRQNKGSIEWCLEEKKDKQKDPLQ